ncbi:HAD family phosphatase [Hamadaea sp. NPDC050747]|uniref:HAD family hydrolase n=1 Tax=Hamadaea sp. NPDC050747 TaxID=3155789 RepID=UPI003403C09A
MIEVLLFDLFGVIARPQSEAGRRRLEALAGVPADAFWAAYWGLREPYDRGEVDGRAYWDQVGVTLGRSLDAEALIAADVASWAALDDEVVRFVGRIDGPRLALLSNIPEEHAVHHEVRLPRLDLVAFSCRIGHAKPEPAAFGWCLDQLQVDAAKVLFVDDTPANIDVAAALGFQTHRFTGLAALRETLQPLVSIMDEA